MKRSLLYLPSLITMALNLLLVSYSYGHLPAELPLHFDLDGNYTATMQSWKLFIYPAVAAGVVTMINIVSTVTRSHSARRRDSNWEHGMAALALCVSLTILSSTCVTLTAGTRHVFMFAEPVLIVMGIACVIAAEVKVRRRK